MRYVKVNRTGTFVSTGIGFLLMSAVAGCATGAAASGASVPTAQNVDEECAGIPAKEREQGLLAYRDAIGGARPLREGTQVGKVEFYRDRGVVLAVRAEPGMSAPWLERVAACHIALATTGRTPASPAGVDPLLVPGATVGVEEAATGFIVTIRVPDDAAASEIARRTNALLTGPSGPATAQVLTK